MLIVLLGFLFEVFVIFKSFDFILWRGFEVFFFLWGWEVLG